MNSLSSRLDAILLVGLNHRIAPVEVREKLAFHPERLQAALLDLRQYCTSAEIELVLLSTCNRTEVYAFSTDPSSTRAEILTYLSDHARLPVGTISDSCYAYGGEQAAHHLLRVAAGLDSLVIGEHEILGQVRTAFEAALSANTIGGHLSALFRAAIQTGKRVRSETEIGKDRLSVATVVVELAQAYLGPLQNHTALLIGAGKISALAARALTSAGLRCVLIANRTFERAQKLADLLGGTAVHFEKLSENLLEADIVITSTGAPHIVLHAETVRQALASRPERPLLVADLAVPRNADPQIGEIDGAYLADIDDLDHLAQTRHPLTAAVRQRAEEIVCEELECFSGWMETRRNAALICALQKHANAIVQAQVQKTVRKLGELTPEQQGAIEAMGKAIASQLLHEPIQLLKTTAADDLSREVEAFFPSFFGLNQQE